MKQILILIFLTMKQQLKNPVFLILLAAVPLTVFAVTSVPSLNETDSICVGICYEAGAELGKMTADELAGAQSYITFTVYNDSETMKNDIITGDLECGYILSRNLEERLDSKNYKNTITLISGADSESVSSLSNELVFSALLKHYGKNIITNYVHLNPDLENASQEILPALNELYDHYLYGNSTFHVEFNTISPDGGLSRLEEIEVSQTVFPLRGLISVLVFAAGLFGSLQYLRDKKYGTFMTMRPSCKIAAAFIYPLTLSLLMGISSLTALFLSDTGEDYPKEICKMLLYLFIITLFCVILTWMLRNETIFAASLPVIITACLVLCPVFINISAVIPGLNIIRRLLPPTFYLY